MRRDASQASPATTPAATASRKLGRRSIKPAAKTMVVTEKFSVSVRCGNGIRNCSRTATATATSANDNRSRPVHAAVSANSRASTAAAPSTIPMTRKRAARGIGGGVLTSGAYVVLHIFSDYVFASGRSGPCCCGSRPQAGWQVQAVWVAGTVGREPAPSPSMLLPQDRASCPANGRTLTAHSLLFVRSLYACVRNLDLSRALP